ncbi:MAG: pyruvate dehydrogenase (acetyl-transferring) E1 component subunit alpha [Thermoflexaceae bacterium]|nr:pyruvate dehydrogenase (acetyl-transferring) E1 component subunit alpha [Thermoflexaceae bacterium]
MTVETAVTGASGGPVLPAGQLERFLYEMAFIRRFEEKAGEMYTRGKIRGFLHLYTGQEACAVGAIHALEERDRVIAHYRDHGHAIAKGVDPKRVMAELYGRVDGTSGGRGGSMHIYDTSKGMMGGYAIVTAHLPVAVGLGLASAMKGENFITLCIFGDGSVGEGEFHEALNLAVLWKVPVIFFCENNLYGMGVSFAESLSTEIPKLAAAYNMPAVSIDGMDVLEVHLETKKAVEHCRAGKGPYFIEAMTYRYRGHSMSDPELYRLKDEIEEYRRRDAITSLRLYMEERGLIDQGRWRELEERVERDVEECIAFAEASPQPSIGTLFDHVTKESNGG